MILGATASVGALVQSLGRITGRRRFQYLAYILRTKGVPELSEVVFRYHHYGPFSYDVDYAVSWASSGVTIVQNTGKLWYQEQYHTFEPGPKLGELVALMSEEGLRMVQDIAQRTKDIPCQELELATAMDFLHRFDEMSSSEAESRALQMMPLCRPFHAQAKQTLVALELN